MAVFLSSDPSPAQKLSILNRLKESTDFAAIDLVILNQVALTLRFEVLRSGKTILCRDQAAQDRFETRTLALYRDMAPLRSRHAEIMEAKYGVSK